MKRTQILIFLASLAVTACGGSDPVTRPPVEPPAATLFVEPRSYCLPAAASGDTLFIHNSGTAAFTWTPQSVPAGSTNLNRTITVDPGTIAAILWTWTPADPLPAVDSLVVTTSDPGLPRVVIPFRREAANYFDVDPPGAPVPALPVDDAVFHPGDSFSIMWSRVSDCSGGVSYQVQISDSPTFTNLLLSQNIGVSSAVIEVDPGEADLGRAYWRVRARDANGLSSVWSTMRSWTVVRVTG